MRTGFAYAFSHGATIVGFCDADFSVDADDLLRLYEMLERSEQLDAVIGSRLALAGSTIERSLIRHLAGRIFATLVTFTLGQKIYDTQCGAKVFRRNQRVIESFADPFISRWAFDVEVIGRINSRKRSPQVGSTIIEVPLLRWIAQPGSKLTMSQQLRTVFELFKI